MEEKQIFRTRLSGLIPEHSGEKEKGTFGKGAKHVTLGFFERFGVGTKGNDTASK